MVLQKSRAKFALAAAMRKQGVMKAAQRPISSIGLKKSSSFRTEFSHSSSMIPEFLSASHICALVQSAVQNFLNLKQAVSLLRLFSVLNRLDRSAHNWSPCVQGGIAPVMPSGAASPVFPGRTQVQTR